jgi:X-Pro dipeptidyl-peptidase
MHKAALAAALLVLAGCAAPPTQPEPTPILYPALAAQEVWVPSSVDGKRLHNALFLPDTPEGVQVPVFVNFSPYWGDNAMAGGDPFGRYLVEHLVPRGYAVVLSAVRGTGHSEGCFQIAGDLELQDSYDVIDHFARQPWSNGRVGAGGKSYDSTTQNGVLAKVPHPALRTVLHVSGITDMYAYNAKAGVPYFFGMFFNHYYWQQSLHEYGLPSAPGLGGLVVHGGSPKGASSLQDEDAESLRRAIDDAACTELPATEASGATGGATGQKDAYWVERDWTPFLHASTWNGSVFFVHGFQDWNVKPDHIDPWLQVLAERGVPVKGWLHQAQQDGTGHVYPMRHDWNATFDRWLDHYLKGEDNGIGSELGYELEGSDGTWRASASWPPAPVATVTAEVLVARTCTDGVPAKRIGVS